MPACGRGSDAGSWSGEASATVQGTLVSLSWDDVRAQWRQWATAQLGGSSDQIDAAADAAVDAAARGLDQASVIRAATNAAAAYDRSVQVGPSSPAAPAAVAPGAAVRRGSLLSVIVFVVFLVCFGLAFAGIGITILSTALSAGSGEPSSSGPIPPVAIALAIAGAAISAVLLVILRVVARRRKRSGA
jgi:hypothetical protein